MFIVCLGFFVCFLTHDSIFIKDQMPVPNDGLVPGGFTFWCDGGKWDLLYGISRGKDLDEQEAKAAKNETM